MTTTMEENRKQLLKMQKGIMGAILDYQIAYGSGSVAWNVSISFIDTYKGTSGLPENTVI